jgi:hypothetical protein
VALHELFGENLASLKPSRLPGGANDTEAATGEFINDAQHQGQFGPDHGQVRAKPLGQGGQSSHIVEPPFEAFGVLRDPPVARHTPNFFYVLTLPEFPHQGMFAAAAAQDQDAHRAIKINTAPAGVNQSRMR